jgi:hypothetical protein
VSPSAQSGAQQPGGGIVLPSLYRLFGVRTIIGIWWAVGTPYTYVRKTLMEQIQKFLGHAKLETTQLSAESSTAMMPESSQRARSR